MITTEKTEKATWIKVRGINVTLITDETPRDAFNKLLKICVEREQLLYDLMVEYEECIAKNAQARKTGGERRNWPVFTRKERVVNQFLKEAGIRNT